MTTSPDDRNVVIVGAGVAGVTAATALRRQGHRGTIDLLDSGDFSYDRPPLSVEYLRGDVDAAGITLGTVDSFAEQDITLRLAATVTAIDPEHLSVVLDTGDRLKADRVVLATGGEAIRPEAMPDAAVVRTFSDAQHLHTELEAGRAVRIVGGGLLGAEIASAAVERGCRVTIVEPNPAPLAPVLGEQFARWWHAQHAVHQVAVERATWQPGDESDELLVLALGMKPEVRLAETAQIEVAGGILVDARQTTSLPAVLAIGDAARRRDGGDASGHWEAAKNDGLRAAAAIGERPPPRELAPWFWSDRYRQHIDVVGSFVGADTVVDRGVFGSPPFAQCALGDGRLLGAVTVDDPRSARTLRKLVGLRIDASQLADPGVDLRTMARHEAT